MCLFKTFQNYKSNILQWLLENAKKCGHCSEQSQYSNKYLMGMVRLSACPAFLWTQKFGVIWYYEDCRLILGQKCWSILWNFVIRLIVSEGWCLTKCSIKDHSACRLMKNFLWCYRKHGCNVFTGTSYNPQFQLC